jgi:ribosome-associated protein
LNISITAPTSKPTTLKRRDTPADLAQWIIEGIRDKKGKHIVQLDMRKLDDAPADYFIICEGDSNVHVKAISDGVYGRVKEEMGLMPVHTEGSMNARWILMDYFNVVVHVFYPETRAFYDLEQLWSDAVTTEYADL